MNTPCTRIKRSFLAPNEGVLSAALLLSVLVLGGCQPTKQRVVVIPVPEPVVQLVADLVEDTARIRFEQELRYQRMIGDMLYEGIKALNANRLLTPPDISAHSYFMRVLAIEPDNAVAKQGIQDIVGKYLQLAEQAGRQGQFDNAKSYLRRGEQVDRTHAGIAQAWVALEAEMNSTDVVHTLNGRELANQSAELMVQLAKIAIEARDTSAFVLITAPNDAQARWIYAQMQAAMEGQRLRGNIELGETPTIRLVKPAGGDA